MKVLKYLSLLLAVVALATMGSSASAQFLLTNGNSEVTMGGDTTMTTWLVDGQFNLFEQDWWIRVDGGVAQRLGSALAPSWLQLSPSVLQGTFTGAGITATATYTLLGGAPGSRTADITEQLLVVTESPVTIFEYTDFDLGGSPSDDQCVRVNANTIDQFDASWKAEEVATPVPSRWEIASFANILNKLQNDPGLDLANATSPFGPGDATYAWQWDLNSGSTIISKDKHLAPVPEPMSVILGMMGLGSIAGFVRLRRK